MRWTFNASYHLGKIIKWLKIFHQLGWAKNLKFKRDKWNRNENIENHLFIVFEKNTLQRFFFG